mgnify:CR=1 FL=1
MLGAFSFTVLEDEWSFAQSIYYSIITVTTIGFGDLVPEIRRDRGASLLKTVYIIFYLTFSKEHQYCDIDLPDSCT